MARIRLLGLWLCRIGIGLPVWTPGGHSGHEACHVSGAREGLWLRVVTRSLEVAGDWWTGFVAENVRVRLGDLSAHIGCLSSAL